MITGAGGASGGQGSVFEALLAMLLSDKVADQAREMSARDPKLDQVRDKLRDGLLTMLGSNVAPPVERPTR